MPLPSLLAFAALTVAQAAPMQPICLHPENGHYFLFRGKPAVLITSGEHYGAVLNGDFNYIPYLDELRARRFNLTRTFSGVYREVSGSFHIVENTLAPKPERYVCPWPRSQTPGAADGGARFDLGKWNPAYFSRLRDFVTQAGERGIVVELVLFCALYDDGLWAVNPMNARNNVQGIGTVSRQDVYQMKDRNLQAVQETLVRKLVAELRDFDNVYFEIHNEPYFGNVSKAWNDRIAQVIADEERGHARHLIAQNIANGQAKVQDPNPHVSVFNFHYASPPDTVAQNYGLNRVIAFDETGFRGKEDRPYRTDAWDFLLAGGAVYSNLDYSFTASRPDGTFPVTTSPGGGGPELRKQLAILKEFMEGFDFVKMRPANDVIKAGHALAPLDGSPPQASVSVRALALPGKAYAAYVKGGSYVALKVDLPSGTYKVEWVNTKTGQVDRSQEGEHAGGVRTIDSPPYQDDVALRIRRTK